MQCTNKQFTASSTAQWTRAAGGEKGKESDASFDFVRVYGALSYTYMQSATQACVLIHTQLQGVQFRTHTHTHTILWYAMAVDWIVV